MHTPGHAQSCVHKKMGRGVPIQLELTEINGGSLVTRVTKHSRSHTHMPLTNLTNLALAPAATRARAQPACRPAMRSTGQAVQPVVTIREALTAGDVQAVVTSLQSVTAAGMETAAVDTGPRSRGWARSYAALKMVVEAMEVHH